MGETIYIKDKGKNFYRDFNTDIATVSRAVNLCPATVTKFVEMRTRDVPTEKIADYLEEIIIQDYNYEISQSIDEITTAICKIEKSWNEYERKENILDKYRKNYGIARKKTVPARLMVKDMLKEMLNDYIKTPIKAKRK